jgi:hypothetical protein
VEENYLVLLLKNHQTIVNLYDEFYEFCRVDIAAFFYVRDVWKTLKGGFNGIELIDVLF